jgi:hypothetical protein
MTTIRERVRRTCSFSHKGTMAQLLQSLFVDPEALARASKKAGEIEACARGCGIEPSKATAFLAELIRRGDVCVARTCPPHKIPEKRKRVISESEGESDGESDGEPSANLDVQVLRGTQNGQDAFVLPVAWHDDGVSVKEGIWFYTLADLQDDDAPFLKGAQCTFYDYLFEGDGSLPVLMRSNHAQTFKPREIMSRRHSTRGINARGRVWLLENARDVAFYDCEKKMVVSHAVRAPEFLRARQRIRARDFLEAIIQRGLGHRTADWRAYFENPESKLEEVEFRPLGPSVQGVCGGCGQQKRLTFKLHASAHDSALLNEDMRLLGSFCARKLEHAPRLAAFALHNRSEGVDTRDLLCDAHAAVHGEEEVE